MKDAFEAVYTGQTWSVKFLLNEGTSMCQEERLGLYASTWHQDTETLKLLCY